MKDKKQKTWWQKRSLDTQGVMLREAGLKRLVCMGMSPCFCVATCGLVLTVSSFHLRLAKTGATEPAVRRAGISVELWSGVPYPRHQHQPLGDLPAGQGKPSGTLGGGIDVAVDCADTAKIAVLECAATRVYLGVFELWTRLLLGYTPVY